MMLMQPKKMASIIVAGRKPDYVDSVGETVKAEYQDDSMGLEAAAESIMAAIQSKDSAKLVNALKNFYYMCEESEPEDD